MPVDYNCTCRLCQVFLSALQSLSGADFEPNMSHDFGNK